VRNCEWRYCVKYRSVVKSDLDVCLVSKLSTIIC
jgi:hypothetical protein